MVDLSRRHLLALTGSTTLGSLTTIPRRTTAKSEISLARRFRAHNEPAPTPPVIDARITITYHDPTPTPPSQNPGAPIPLANSKSPSPPTPKWT